MVEESKGPKKRMPEDFISRFRSKEDLYRYMTQQGKLLYILWKLVKLMFSFHQCRVPRLALWGISLVRLSCVSSRMMLIIWKCLLIRRSRLRTSMWMLSKMNCLWSTFLRKNNSLEGCLSKSSSLVFCAPWGTSTWRTSSLRLTSRDTLSVTMTPRSKELRYQSHGLLS